MNNIPSDSNSVPDKQTTRRGMTRFAAAFLAMTLPAMGLVGCAGLGLHKPEQKGPGPRITSHGHFLPPTHLVKQTFGSGNGTVLVTTNWTTDPGYHLTGETVSCFLATTPNTVGPYCQKVTVGSQLDGVNTKQISFAFSGVGVGSYYVYTYSTGTISDTSDPNLAPLPEGVEAAHCAHAKGRHHHHHRRHY